MTNPLETFLAEIEARANAATPNYVKAPLLKSEWPERFNDVANVRGVRIIGDYKSNSCGEEAEFIIRARTDIPALIAMLKLAVSQRDGYRQNYHDVCRLPSDERIEIETDNDAALLEAARKAGGE